MAAWVWPRMLALMLSALLLLSACLQPASRWDTWMQAQSSAVLAQVGWTLGRPALIGSAELLHGMPHLGWLRAAPMLQGLPEPIRAWALWPARAAVHGAVLALWLGLCSPVLLVYARQRCMHAAEGRRSDSVSAALVCLTVWPLWRRGLGSLPLCTLVWSITPPATLALAPGFAGLWLFAAGALWWPIPPESAPDV